jgi:hypothetical protein
VLATADTAIVLPPLRRLLDHAPVDGPHWPQIAEALSRHGHVHVALAVLRPRLDVPASVHDGARDECVRGVPWALADRLDRVTTHAWLRELYLPGADPVAEANRLMAIWNVSGIAGVARGWFESIGNDKADAAGHAFLHQLTTHERDTAFTDFARHALYGGVFDDSWKADRRDADGDEPLTAERALERLQRLRRIDADLERRTDSDDPYEERKPDRAFCTLLQQSEVLLGRDAVRDEAERWLDEAVVPVADDDLRVERLLSRLNLLLHAGISDPRWHVRVADEARRLRGDNRTELVSWLALNS